MRIGSTITAAISPGYAANSRSTAARSLNCAIRVLASVALVIPSPPGTDVGRSGIADFVRLWFDGHQHRIVETVVSTFHLDHALPPGRRARQPHRVHRAFRAAVAESHHLHRKPRADLLGQRVLRIVRHPEHCPGLELRLDGVDHRGMAVPGHERAEAHVEIDVLVPIDVPEACATGVADVQGDRAGTSDSCSRHPSGSRAAALACAAREAGVRRSYVSSSDCKVSGISAPSPRSDRSGIPRRID